MKKIFILTAVFALLSMSLNAQVQTTKKVVKQTAQTENGSMKAPNRATVTGSVTAADGTSTSTGYQWLPVYGYYFESAQTSQMIYRAAQLDGLQAGDKITSLTFYPNGNIAFSGGSITLSLGNTSISQFSSNSALSVSTTQVARVTSYPVSNGAWTITFTTPFTYTGENILVQVATTSGDYGRTYFYGQDQTNYQSRNSYGSTNRYYFLPKIKLDYERSDDPEISASPTSVSLNSIPGGTSTQTVAVSALNLTSDITATISGADASLFSVSPASLGTSGGSLTITYTPTAVGTHTATLTLSSTGAQDVTISLNGACTQDLTICNGDESSSYLPVYGNWYDSSTGQKNQMIYPASELTSLVGKNITSMTFYAPNGISFSGGSVTFSIGETNTSSFSSATALNDNVTAVATVVPNGETEWTIIFTNPYTYNGGNLLIQVDTQTGTYSSTSFTGMNMGSNVGYYSYTGYSGVSNNVTSILPTVTFTFEETGPNIKVSPETLTINDSGTNNTFTVQGSNLGGDNVGLTQSGSYFTPTLSATAGWSTDGGTYWYFTPDNGSLNGTVAMNYTGRELSASETVTLANNVASATVTVNYRADLYIVGDFGNGWDFSDGTQMTYNSNDNTYTANITVDAGNLILFARKLGESNPWNTRYVFGPNSSGDWWVDTNPKTGTIDLNDDDPIYFVTAGNYTIEINASTGALTIEKLVLPPPENVVATPDNDNLTATVTWDAPSDLPTVPGTVNQSVTEGFENGTTGWTFIDADGDGYNWTWNDNSSSSSNMITNNGTCIVYSESYHNSETGSGGTILYPQNWLISPEVVLDGTLSLYACGQDGNGYHNEVFGVYVCVGSYNNVSEFVQVGADVTTTHSMAEYTYDLSQYQGQLGHIAIVHHNVNDQFILNIDDITYQIAVPGMVTIEPESYNVYLDGQLVGNVDADDSLTYDFNNLAAGNHTVEISAVYPGNIESEKVPAQFTITPKTATPEITYVVNGDNVVITATGDGTVNLTTSDGQSASGNGSASITVPRTDATFSVTATATAQESGKLESDPATETITIPFLQTAAPSISVSEPDANGNVVVTATGDGTVTLTTSDGQSVSGSGSVSITLPQQAHDYTVTATAQAQESGKAASETVTQSVTVPGKIDDTWKEMTGTYTNDNDVLSFLTIVNGDTTDIMMVDQFMVSTLNNDHPDHYDYVMTETINGEVKYSNEVEIPVYKTNSSIQGLYTQTQVDSLDLKMGLRANVVNTKMDYDVNPDHNVLYYSLYRSDLDATYPEITVDSRISQLQKFEDNVDGNIQYYMFENHPTGVAPRYDHLGHEIAERLDTNWVECDFGQKLAYVPVIWTFGLYSGREDGKNNSYGSDIKREELGAVTVTVEGKHSDGSSMGKFTYDGQEYCIYHPVFNIEATAPQTITQGDGDVCTYVPYMYRAWCTYEGMRDYTADENGLKDNGPLAAPYLLGEEVTTNSQCHIGKNWTQGDGRLQNGFAIPTNVPDGDVTFIVRFYYKKAVAEAQSNGNKLRLGNGEGEEYFIAQAPADGDSMVTGISELMNGVTPVSVTYVNTQGMKSDKPFDGVNIVVTRYSDGSTVTSKIIR